MNETVGLDLKTPLMLTGQGLNSVTGQQGGMAVVYNGEDDLVSTGPADGQTVEFTLQQLTSLSEVRTRLGLTAGASLGFGFYSGDAAGKFVRETTYNEFSTFLYVDVSVLYQPQVIKKAVLTESALERAKQGSAQFLDFAGNAFISGIQLGGRITAVIELEAQSSSEREQVSATVNAALGSFQAGGGFEKAFQKLAAVTRQKVWMLRRGTSDAIPDINGLRNACLSFPERLQDPSKRVVVNVLTRSYSTVDNFPYGLIDMALLQQQAKTLGAIATYIEDLYAAQGSLSYISRNINLFDDDGKLKQEVDNAFVKNQKTINELISAAEDVRLNPELPPPSPPNVMRVKAPYTIDKVEPEPIVVLFQHDNYQGGRVDLTSSTPNLQAIGFNDELSSFKVLGAPGEYKVEFFEAWDYTNPFLTVLSPYHCPKIPLIHVSQLGQPIPVQPPNVAASPGLFAGAINIPFPKYVSFNDACTSVRITKMT